MRRATGIMLAVLIVAGFGLFGVLNTRQYPATQPEGSPTEAINTRSPSNATATIAANTPVADLRGNHIDVNGQTLFLTCTGTSSPTVILEAGLGADHTTWSGIQPAVAQFTQVCSYDRAGLGQSDPASTPRTSQDVVDDLHALLQAADIPGPYVLVAHSFGGLHARLYAHDYPDEVAGVMLIDAVHEDWWTRASAMIPPATATDNERLTNFRHYMTEGYKDPAQNREGLDIEASAAQVRATGALGNTPLVVITAGIPNVLSPGLPTDLETQLNTLMQQELQTDLAELSSDSVHLLAAQSGHAIHRDQPDLVIQTIKTFVEGIRRQSRVDSDKS